MICHRPFFQKLFYLSLLVFLCMAFPLSVHAQDSVLDSIDAYMHRLQSRYGIFFKYKDFPKTPQSVKFSEVSQDKYEELIDFLSLFEAEINQYPPGFFKDRGVKGIGLVPHLFLRERD